MLGVKRPKSNTQKFFAIKPRIYISLNIWTGLNMSGDEVAQLQARCNDFSRYPEPQHLRDEVHSAPELEWMHMEENQPESPATGSGGLSTNDTTLLEGVEQSSLAAAGDRLPVHLSISFSTEFPRDPQATPASSNVLVEERERLAKDSASREKGSRTT